MAKYYVLKPFLYDGKQYERGDEFPVDELKLHSSKVDIRVKARIIIEENKLTATDKAKLLRDRTNVKTVTTITKQAEKPVDKPVEKEEPKAVASTEPVVEEPTLFNTNVGGGKGKNKNRNN